MSTTKANFTHEIEMRRISALRSYARNARTHSRKQVRQIADSIQRFGFTNPVLVSDDDEIIAGHGRVMAAKDLGHISVPTLRLSHLSPAERRAYVLADDKLALNAGGDNEILATELQALIDIDFDISLTGFSLAEVPPIFISEFFVLDANSRLPKRMQLDDIHLIIRTLRIRALRKPELQQQLKHDWAEIGLPIKANAATPSLISLLTKLGIDVPELLTEPTDRSNRRYRARQ